MVTTQFSGPFDGSPIATQDQWRDFLSFLGEGVVRDVDSELTPSVSADGTTVTLAGGAAVVQAATYQQSGDPWTSVIPANGTGGNRGDRLVLAYDPVAKTVSPQVKAGTSSSLPGLTRTPGGTWEMPMAHWTKQSGGGVTGFVDDRLWLGPGLMWGTSASRGAGMGPGRIMYETDTGRWVGWNGSAWKILAEDTGWVDVSPTGLWAVNGASKVIRRNGWTQVRVNVKRTDSDLVPGNFGTDRGSPVLAPLAATYRPAVDQWNDFYVDAGDVNGRCTLHADDGGLYIANIDATIKVGAVLLLTLAPYPSV